MLLRNIIERLKFGLSHAPVVLLQGARQTGKSTLVQMLASQNKKAQYLTMDDAEYYSAAISRPQDFVTRLSLPAYLDEIQKAAEIFLPIKLVVDRNRKPGQFLLTGSANVLLLPKLSESLVGRMQIINLWPLSQGEIIGLKEGFVDFAFSEQVPPRDLKSPEPQKVVLEKAIAGGYPEPLVTKKGLGRNNWFASYLTMIIERDVRELAELDRLATLPNLIQLLSLRIGGLLNISDIASKCGVPHTSMTRYIKLLESTFMVKLLPPWSPRRSKRLTKTPKAFLVDTGLAAYLSGATEEKLDVLSQLHSRTISSLLENFVVMELIKQESWSNTECSFNHFRTAKGMEVDLVLEDRAGKIVGIEIKLTTSVNADDFRGLRFLADTYPDQFHRGFVLYCGDKIVPFGFNMWCLPVSSLWQINAKKQKSQSATATKKPNRKGR